MIGCLTSRTFTQNMLIKNNELTLTNTNSNTHLRPRPHVVPSLFYRHHVLPLPMIAVVDVAA